MKKNIILIYIYSFLIAFFLFRSCDTLYYLDKGVTFSKYILFIVVMYIIYTGVIIYFDRKKQS